MVFVCLLCSVRLADDVARMAQMANPRAGSEDNDSICVRLVVWPGFCSDCDCADVNCINGRITGVRTSPYLNRIKASVILRRNHQTHTSEHIKTERIVSKF